MKAEQKVKMLQKLASIPEALQRDPLKNYTEGTFHITLNVRERFAVLGFIDILSKCVTD